MKMERVEKRIAILYMLRKHRLQKILEEYHLSYEDYQVVLALHYMDGASVDEIIEETKIDPRLISSILKHLEKRDFIRIDNNKIYSTDKNEEIYPQMKKIIKKSNEAAIKEIGKEEYQQIVETLDKLIEFYE